MKRRGLRFGTLLSAVAALGMAVAACGAATPTQIIVYITLPPSSVTATATGAVTAGTSQRPTPTSARTPAPSKTPKPSPTPAVSVTPGPTATPYVSFTLPPVGSPVPSAACTGSAGNQAFFGLAATDLPFNVYCAVLPATWWPEAHYTVPSGGDLEITYHGPGGVTFNVREGAFCTGGTSLCTPRDHPLGTAMFSDQVGGLVALGPTASYGFAIYVNGGSTKAYEVNSTALTQAKLIAYARAMIKVAKP